MNLPTTLEAHQPAVEHALREVMAGPTGRDLPLYRMMQYQLGWVGQDGAPETTDAPVRFYGAVCMEAAQAGIQPERASFAAAAAELFHESVTVHEEMQMGDPHTDERPAAWWVWGPAQAINVGDGLHAMARLAVLNLQAKGLTSDETLAAMHVLDATALRFYEGQYMELTFQERIDITEAQYLRLAETKYGSLLGGAMALGAQAAGASSEVVEALRQCGARLGVAGQLFADVTQLWDRTGAQGAAPKVLSKSKLFPVVHALEHATLAQKRALGDAYFKRVMERGDVERVRGVLEEAGAREYTEQKARTLAREAVGPLEAAGLPPELQRRWSEVADSLVTSRI